MQASIAKGVNRSLREVFGLERLRPFQREVIEHVFAGADVLAIMPTGAGKSLCYQLPGLHLDGMTIVISPLISLMKDQADKLEELGVEAASLNSAISESEQKEALEAVEDESSEFVFTTPERFTDAEFLGTLKGAAIDLVVVDEAHCISQWGHDFRPAFLELKDAIARLGKPRVLALTATATPEVVEDIRKQLGRPRMEVIRGGVYRDNLEFSVIHTTSDHEKRGRLEQQLREVEGSKIVYCATVKAVNEIAKRLKDNDYDVESYHGQLSAKRRTEVQDAFMSGEVDAIIATNAFGMGVDKPDIRAVIHWQMPGSLESYYQEAGRAGRDGDHAKCVLLYDTRDRRVQQFFLGGRYPTGEEVFSIYGALGGAEEALSMDDLVARLDGEVAKNKIRVALNLLKDESVVRERRGRKFEVVKDGLDEEAIEQLTTQYVERGTSDRERLEKMMLFAQSALCRWNLLDAYFQTDKPVEKCGHCDNCIAPMEERLKRPASHT